MLLLDRCHCLLLSVGTVADSVFLFEFFNNLPYSRTHIFTSSTLSAMNYQYNTRYGYMYLTYRVQHVAFVECLEFIGISHSELFSALSDATRQIQHRHTDSHTHTCIVYDHI